MRFVFTKDNLKYTFKVLPLANAQTIQSNLDARRASDKLALEKNNAGFGG